MKDESVALNARSFLSSFILAFVAVLMLVGLALLLGWL